MTYSKRSLELAAQLRQKAIDNLKRGEYIRMWELRQILNRYGVPEKKIQRILDEMWKHW